MARFGVRRYALPLPPPYLPAHIRRILLVQRYILTRAPSPVSSYLNAGAVLPSFPQAWDEGGRTPGLYSCVPADIPPLVEQMPNRAFIICSARYHCATRIIHLYHVLTSYQQYSTGAATRQLAGFHTHTLPPLARLGACLPLLSQTPPACSVGGPVPWGGSMTSPQYPAMVTC